MPVFTIAYYLYLEKFEPSDLVFQGFIVYMIELVVFWHFFSRIIRTCFEIDRKQKTSMWPYFILAVVLLILKVVYYFVWTESTPRTNSFLLNFFCALYVILTLISGTTIGEMSQDFWYLVTDAILLS
jgi:uncharacterized membrane protein HdeD (DUF308 family)